MHTVPSIADCVKLHAVPEPGSAVPVWAEINNLEVCEGVAVNDSKIGNKTHEGNVGVRHCRLYCL